jgi:hypothetical protein
MELVNCICKKCDTFIGKFENLWDKIGKTYYSPLGENDDYHEKSLKVAPDSRPGPAGGVLENR